uniref:Aminotransferase-like plant mobile domain-containing protein n=1 Tax=Quercus lobata TaxID=97700 RepID=A0A7N2LRF3_QUELO
MEQQYHISNDAMEGNDIAILTGLPIDGNAVCEPINLTWSTECRNLLGVTPPETALKFGGLKITWVRDTFSNLPEGANAITTQQHARAYMFQVLDLLFGNKSQSRLHCCFLKLLDDFGVAGEYSWGSATLAYLYKELCTAAIKKSMEIAGPVFILQLWAWEHLPYLTPIPINPTNLNGDDPYGCRKKYMDYNSAIAVLPNCRVLPPRKSHATVWVVAKMSKHDQYYERWNMRAELLVGDDHFDSSVDYATWYQQNGHLFTTPEAAAHIYQQTEVNKMLNLAVANQQRNDLIAQQVLPPIVEGLTRLKLSMEANISSVPTERVTNFERRQRRQGRQPQTYTETHSSTSAQRGQCRNDDAGPSTSAQHNMYSSTQAGPSTFAGNEPTTFSEYNPINVNEYCMNLYQQIGSSTSIGQGFEGLFSYDQYPQPNSTPPSYHPSPPPSYAGQYNYGQDSQYNYDFCTPQPSQPPPHVGDFCTPQNTWVCAPNSEEEASVTDSEEDASNEDSGEDAEDTQEMEVSSDNEDDDYGNYQTEVDIRTQPRRMGRSPVQARRYPQRENRHPPCCGTQQKLNVPHRRNH